MSFSVQRLEHTFAMREIAGLNPTIRKAII